MTGQIDLAQLRDTVTDSKSAYEGTAPGHYERWIPDPELLDYDDLLALIDTAAAAVAVHAETPDNPDDALQRRARLRQTLSRYTT